LIIQIDLNAVRFQNEFFALDTSDAKLVMKLFRKLQKMDWQTVQSDKGLHWERVKGTTTQYSIRINQKARAVVTRRENAMCFESLHFDHDSAYE
jgi:plasmid maintenance system killer protein